MSARSLPQISNKCYKYQVQPCKRFQGADTTDFQIIPRLLFLTTQPILYQQVAVSNYSSGKDRAIPGSSSSRSQPSILASLLRDTMPTVLYTL